MNIVLLEHINRWLEREIFWKPSFWNQRGKEILDRCSKWQLVQVEKKMVCSFLLHACQPPPVCCFRSQGRDLFTKLAVSVFPLCLILENQIWGCLAQNVLSAACITHRKQKVYQTWYHSRYLSSSSLLDLITAPILLQKILWVFIN